MWVSWYNFHDWKRFFVFKDDERGNARIRYHLKFPLLMSLMKQTYRLTCKMRILNDLLFAHYLVQLSRYAGSIGITIISIKYTNEPEMVKSVYVLWNVMSFFQLGADYNYYHLFCRSLTWFFLRCYLLFFYITWIF